MEENASESMLRQLDLLGDRCKQLVVDELKAKYNIDFYDQNQIAKIDHLKIEEALRQIFGRGADALLKIATTDTTS